ncbi:serine hydrolase [Lacimicrobium sp. SS2-24]|uniref:serine hydrolase domain-containing protein n=1 Tax=Lacimicrobium sp. SS2-24 TaxID=2005569 RepID=UPI000B4BDDC2|nr:serine hydrolase [Lacimicrobium sp. SS2-24]
MHTVYCQILRVLIWISVTLITTTSAQPLPDVVAADEPKGSHRDIAQTCENVQGLLHEHAGIHDNALFTGAAVLIAHKGRVMCREAVGHAQLLSLQDDGNLVHSTNPIRMSADSIFDLASVSKVAATTISIMHLVSNNQLALEDTLGELLPEFKHTDKAAITVQQLLTHRSGLLPWQPTWLYLTNAQELNDYIASLPLGHGPGERRAYSDLGFMLLGNIIEAVSGKTLEQFVHTQLYAPLGMQDTGYTPLPDARPRIAATSHGNPYERNMVATGKPYPLARPPKNPDFNGYRKYTLIGEANDGNTWYGLEGVAGHAGLFSTLDDLAILGQMLVNGGTYQNYTVTDKTTLETFLQTPFDDEQAHGFRKGQYLDQTYYWHPGFTGTYWLINPKSALVVVLLTNRQHGGLNHETGRYPSLTPIWRQVVNIAHDAIATKTVDTGRR